MPYIRLEHTENIDLPVLKLLLKQLKNILVKNARVKEENCKCKAIQIPVYVVGKDGDSKHYYHLEISLKKRRYEEVRQILGQKSLQILLEYITSNTP